MTRHEHKRVHTLRAGDRIVIGANVYTLKRDPQRARARGYWVITLDGNNKHYFPTGTWSAHGDNLVTVETEHAE